MRRLNVVLGWFVDDDDITYTRWRGFLLWVIVVGLIVGVAFTIGHFGHTSSGSGSCPPSWAAAGDC